MSCGISRLFRLILLIVFFSYFPGAQSALAQLQGQSMNLTQAPIPSGSGDRSSNSSAGTNTNLTAPSGWTLKPGEKELAWANPLKFIRFVAIAYSIHQLVVQLCELPSLVAVSELEGDEESDALRHFLLAAAASAELGLEFAEAFLTAHEGPADQLTDSNRMDLANNQVGYREATTMARLSTKEKVLRGLELIRNGSLVRLRTGANQCSRLVQEPEPELKLRVHKFFNPEEKSPDPHLI